MPIKIDHLSKEIAKLLQEYTAEVEDGLRAAQEKVAKKTVKHLKGISPKKTGDYAKGWRAKKVSPTVWVVHNATDYQLTHLLEYGHAKVGGGRVAGKPHIRPAEEQAIDEFEQEMIRVIQR